MKHMKRKDARIFEPNQSTTITEYQLGDTVINGAIADIRGRYPENGLVTNTLSRELVYILDGRGSVTVGGEETHLSTGDMLIIEPNEAYFWQGPLKIFMANTPSWTPEQHLHIQE